MARRGVARGGRVLGVVAAAVLVACAPTSCARTDGPGPPAPTALVYRGPATGCDECSEAVAGLLRSSDLGFDVTFVGPGEEVEVTAATLGEADLYVQPGGNLSVDAAMDRLGADAADVITSYVHGGGRYLGLCLGAYLAGSDPGLGLLSPGDTGGYSSTRGAGLTGSQEGIIRVAWGSKDRWHYAQDPPVILASKVDGERVLSRFSNGQVNALVRPLGDGVVGVVGTHPEATRDWYSDTLWRADTDGLDLDDGLELIDAVMAPSSR